MILPGPTSTLQISEELGGQEQLVVASVTSEIVGRSSSKLTA